MKVVNLKDEKKAVKEVLEKAVAEEFESIMLFGIKEGRYRIMSTSMKDRLRVIGFLEAAKSEVWIGDTND
jgi:hypothetical protein